MPGESGLNDTITLLDRAISSVNLKYAIIGGTAVIIRGYERSTQDVDAVVLGADDKFDELCAAFLSQGFRFRKPNGEQFARRHRIILLESPDGTGADVSMGALPFEIEMVGKATREVVFENVSVPVVAAEDLMIMKLIASRDQDHDDVGRLFEIYPDVNLKRIKRIVTDYAEILERPEILDGLKVFARKR